MSLTLSSPSKGQVLVKPNTVPGEDGYLIDFSTYSNKKFKRVANLDYATKEYLQEGLKSKKTYYYRVRAYRLVNGKTIYGPWSSIKKITVK